MALALLLCSNFALAQAPPSTGAYSFQGQGNLAQVFSSLANPQSGQVPFGTKLGSYSLLVPFGDLSPGTALGQFNVIGLHFGTQTCSSSPCAISAAMVLCNASTGPITIQLPGANGTGFFTAVEKTDLTANACIVTAAGSDTITGIPSISLTTPFLPILLDDSAQGAWFAGLLGLATGSTSGGNFPLLANGDFNNFAGINIGGLALVKQPAPSNFVATATCSGTCATTYTYQVSCLTAFGENGNINGAPDTTTATNAASLSVSNNNSLAWTFQPQCRSGYNIYGRLGGALGLLTTLPQTTTTFVDNGSIVNPANSYTFSFSSAAFPAVQIWDLQGAALSSSVDVNVAGSGALISMPIAAVTTTATNDLQVAIWGTDKTAGAVTGPGSFTSTTTVAANPNTNYGLLMTQRNRASAGSTGTVTATQHLAVAWAGLNIAIKAANPATPITVGNTPTFTASAPYTSVTFGDPSGTSTGDLELVCLSFLQGTSPQVPAPPAQFKLIGSVLAGTSGKVQLSCYLNAPTVGGLPPPPSTNTTGSITQVTETGQVYNENLLGLGEFDGGSGNIPNGGASSAIMKSTSWPVAMTVQSCRVTWVGLVSCSPFPTFAIKDTTAGNVLCSSGLTSVTATDQAVTPTNTAIPANDVVAFLATTNGGGCAGGQTNISMVVHQ